MFGPRNNRDPMPNDIVLRLLHTNRVVLIVRSGISTSIAFHSSSFLLSPCFFSFSGKETKILLHQIVDVDYKLQLIILSKLFFSFSLKASTRLVLF